MNKYLTLEEAAEYLRVSSDTIKRYVEKGELPVYKLDRSVRFKTEDIDNLVRRSFEVLLVPGLRAMVSHSVQIQEGVGAWRVIVKFRDTTGKALTVAFGPKRNFTEYYVSVTEEYLEDHARLCSDVKGAEKFALRYITKRFEETKDNQGERTIERINENSVVCYQGQCRRGDNLSLPIIKTKDSL